MQLRDYEPFVEQVVRRYMTSVERAKKAGTLNAVDRSAQYRPPYDVVTPDRLLCHLNELGAIVRGLLAEKERMQERLMHLKLRNGVIVGVVTGLVSRAPDIWHLVRAWIR